MDAENSAPAPRDTNSPGAHSFLSASLTSGDPVNGSSIGDHVLKADTGGMSSSSSSVSDGGGFASGEEEFESAPEADTDLETPVDGVIGDDSDHPLKASTIVEFDDDDERVVGGDKIGELKEEPVEGVDMAQGKLENGGMGSGEKGGEAELSSMEISGSEGIKNGALPTGEAKQLTERDGVKFTDEGDAVVDSLQVDLTPSGAVVVGDVEESGGAVVNAAEAPVGGDVKLENKFGVINSEVDEPEDVSAEVSEPVKGDGAKPSTPADTVVDSRAVAVGDLKASARAEDEGVKAPADIGDESDQIGYDVVKADNSAAGGLELADIEKSSGEEEGVKFTAEGDAVVDSINVDLTPTGTVVVGDVETSGEAENKEVEAPVSVGVELENKFDQISRDAEDPNDLVDLVGADSGPNDGKLVEGEDVKFTSEGDSIVDSINIDVTASGTVVVPDIVDGNKEAEVGNGVDGVSHDVEEPDDMTSVYDASHELVSANKIDTAEPEIDEQKKHTTVEGADLDEEKGAGDVTEKEITLEAISKEKPRLGEAENGGSGTDGENDGMVFGSPEAARQFLEELERASGGGSSNDHSQRIDGQILTDSDEEVDTEEEGEGKELFDSATLAALLKAATGASSDGGNITATSQDGTRLFSVERPAGLGSSLRSVRPAPRSSGPNLSAHLNAPTSGDSETNLSDEDRKKLEKLQQIRVKYLRLVQRLGHSVEDPIAAQVLYRLALLTGRKTSQEFSLDSAKRASTQLEAEAKDDLEFSLNVLVLGKAGVGKSATINSIFGEEKAEIHAFDPATTAAREITGILDGVRIRIIDTPGLKSAAIDQTANRRILSSTKKLTKKYPPDIVLYVDRLDAQTRDLNDLPLLRTITSTLGSSIWRNVIVTLTHAASAPPEGPSGSPLSYEVFVAQRSHVVQQSIGQAVGDLRLMNPSLMNPVALAENHPNCRKNRDGQKVLPNGQAWRPQLLMLCYSLKIISEASSLSKPQDPFDHRKLFGFRVRSPPLPYLLSWLLQSRAHPKVPADQGGENGDSDIEMDDMPDSDQEDEEDEYDQLPPFKPLRKAQLAKLSKEQRKAYHEEYDYRVKLLKKKQWGEELRRMRQMKKRGKVPQEEYGYTGEDDPEDGAPAAVPVPLPDMVLPPSFDADNPAYRYRFLEPSSQLLARPVMDSHGWDHDCGYDGVNLENSLAIASRFPAAIAVQVTKDKKDFNIHLDSSISAKHGENGSTVAGFDIQNVGKQLAYIVRGETKFKNLKKNKTAAGFSVTFLGENVATGVKVEDQIAVGKRVVLVGSTGTVRSQGDAAYGANLEVRLREADYPIGQDQSSLGLSLVKWRGDLALGANLQSQFSVGRGSKVAVRAGLNNKLSGQISVRTSSSDQLQIALIGFLPIAMAIYKSIRPGVNENNYSMY